MTPQRAKELLPIITAYANGETIEYRIGTGQFYSQSYPVFDGSGDYRIKSKPQYRPWKHDECPKTFIVESVANPKIAKIACKQSGYDHVRFWKNEGSVEPERITFDDLLRDWLHIHEDGMGSPCGVKLT